MPTSLIRIDGTVTPVLVFTTLKFSRLEPVFCMVMSRSAVSPVNAGTAMLGALYSIVVESTNRVQATETGFTSRSALCWILTVTTWVPGVILSRWKVSVAFLQEPALIEPAMVSTVTRLPNDERFFVMQLARILPQVVVFT